ncbi:helix-turn-helix domain-containing protein [Flavobacterium aurantiibacter]|uniref:helix-turn-helix domain-containing protein n=1 Tax=Flavobacterium aurantiibacter TaxID=2023067 RepID=UPI001FB02A5B|nr:helix-turn-helix transcriptional regulator [Flavobacterium aurantiibacter]
MDSIDEIAERIKEVMHRMSESPTSFADKLQVQRSSISHILSGRNKPSLDFVLKLLHAYPSISADYILFGTAVETIQGNKTETDLDTNNETTTPSAVAAVSSPNRDKKLKQVVLLYEDGTFSTYLPQATE